MWLNLACYNYPNMHSPNRFLKLIPPLALAITLMAVYLATMAPGLTWSNFGADGGDLISAASTGGVAHPTGYPTYLLLARLFQFLPFGTLAFRTNLLSGVTAAAASLLVYFLTCRFLSADNSPKYWLAGLAAGLGFGLSPLLWSQAVITEVYALNAFFVVLLLLLSESPASSQFPQTRKDRLLGLTFGLAMGNHITIGFLFPILFFGLFHRVPGQIESVRNLRFDGRPFWRRSLWTGIGLLVYLALPLRALSRPPVNWGNPVTPAGFEWLVSGKLYQDQMFASPFPLILERIRSVAAIFLNQFGLIGLTLGLAGLIVFYRPGMFYRTLLWITAIFSVFAIIYSTNDSFVYLIPVFFCFSVWLGIGVGRIMDAIARRGKAFPVMAGGAVLLVLLVQAGLHWNQVDASRDTRAESFGKTILAEVPAGAIVFAKGDQAIFSLWYFHYGLHARPDLAVIASDLLQFDWYLQTLRSNYPSLDLSEPFPFPETVIVLNPTRLVCYVQYFQLPVISCEPPRGLATP